MQYSNDLPLPRPRVVASCCGRSPRVVAGLLTEPRRRPRAVAGLLTAPRRRPRVVAGLPTAPRPRPQGLPPIPRDKHPPQPRKPQTEHSRSAISRSRRWRQAQPDLSQIGNQYVMSKLKRPQYLSKNIRDLSAGKNFCRKVNHLGGNSQSASPCCCRTSTISQSCVMSNATRCGRTWLSEARIGSGQV